MSNHADEIEALRKIFADLGVPNRSAIRIAGKLCGIAARVDRLECYCDSDFALHVLLNGVEVFQCNINGGISNFRNLLAVMYSHATQFADNTKSPKLSPYGLDCVITPPKDAGESAAMVRLETVNTGSEQRFCFSKV